ncbi:MAG: hypothetical protein HC896_11930 [Bacteroidales bacterium]|nr:hypothetical protein [Bacteroidales bacterium]
MEVCLASDRKETQAVNQINENTQGAIDDKPETGEKPWPERICAMPGIEPVQCHVKVYPNTETVLVT